MILSKKRWQVERPDVELVQALQNDLQLSAIAAKILAARGCETTADAESLLNMTEANVHDPFLMHGMAEAVARIEQALDNGEKILVYGDYDADGVTSTTVMLNVLLDLGANVSFKIPNRFIHGYGPHEALFREAYEEGVQLIITVDNGISGIEPIRVAKELGLDVIVTDHHEPGEELPPADIILHPRLPEGHYPFGELAGVGVAFKLAHALYGELPTHLIEYVAIGTVADLVPLVDENRYLVKRGIEEMRRSLSPWVQAMCDIASTEQAKISEETIGFYFGPRLNAVGRLGEASPGVELLMAEDSVKATALAKQLNASNTERKDIVKNITEEAIALIESEKKISDSLVLVVAGEGWNAGVVGIVASRLVEQYYRPTIVLSLDPDKGTAKGSARSIDGFHLYNELAKNRDILPHFGGHPMAAGMTLSIEHVDELRSRLDTQARACLTEEHLTPVVHIDIPLSLDEISADAIEEIASLGPFGTDFPKPVYVLEDVEISSMRKIGAAENHIKMELTNGCDKLDSVGFHKGHLHDELTYGIKVSFIGDLQINEWQGRKKAQFMIEDVQTTEWQLFDIRGIRQTARWLNTVPKEEATFIAFRPATMTYYQSLIDVPIIVADPTLSNIGQSEYIVLLDLPETIQRLEEVLQKTAPSRIYAHFYMPDSQYFNVLPTREQFAWYYKFLKNRPAFPLDMHIADIAKHTGWPLETLKFMTQVFFELDFVKMESGLTTVNEDAPKQALTEAPSYKQRSEQIEMEQMLVYAPYIELKQWFDERIHD
ncbi:single-stranded-DNA-specific exonuclease RecJ [Lysinibacillus sp. fkY74-1]|uniref:Single-stranded-DNA-specific exonuclease RecJ n=3 Tax=Lysinibacillus TaxID=400634 RepID=B1HV84_LYSSC|nr:MULTISPECIES: single-stranded-DNA-specific exonuclease RecJ [Lysinibacillus]MBE5082833.1 single-stranded-DNA-specific exonuclease RecJ [Bacillus thuringiensis]ACA41386.1 Single-stranded-DNA-specific exonuclease recJ [Lysinibacillus sphaericus C3-41]AMO32722.1 single-stranded-DNA-specific exonuclease RecJ [Lysinibacillus sphaericus]AMR92176.1 single-stranded-DNA-specific exonuclease RecJ [Lysinibacillus sphaericus]ANA46225.1 single-stranded-DNA-specific exonuclease RecJ [Lysinibacillus sphae